MIVVAIIGLLSAIALPNLVKARVTSQTNACINNLRQIDSAKHQWALENNQPSSATPSETDLAPYMGRGEVGLVVNVSGGNVEGQLNCPTGGTYTINDIATPPGCDAPGHELP